MKNSPDRGCRFLGPTAVELFTHYGEFIFTLRQQAACGSTQWSGALAGASAANVIAGSVFGQRFPLGSRSSIQAFLHEIDHCGHKIGMDARSGNSLVA